MNKIAVRILLSAISLTLISAFDGKTFASEPVRRTELPSDSIVNDISLDSVRGGFDLGSGFNVSFGIERAVYVNGALVTSTGFYLKDLTALNFSAPLLTITAKDSLYTSSLAIKDSMSVSALSKLSLPLVLQNQVDGQALKSITTINATVPSLSGLRSINLGETLQNAIGSLQINH